MENITRSSYLVDVSKGNGIVEFTKAHLELHKTIHNPNTKPEYYNDLMPFGLEYVDTILMESDDIQNILDNPDNVLLQQEYRKGTNTEYNRIKNSMLNGFDVRQKPLQIVINEDGTPSILFNGNTTNNILFKYTNVQNRIVAIYRKNTYFSKGNLLLIGGNQNALESPSGSTSFDDVVQIIDGYIQTKELTLVKNPTSSDTEVFVSKVERLIQFASNGTIEVKTNVVRRFINEKIEEITGVHKIMSVKTPNDVLNHLSRMGYKDTPNHHHHASSAIVEKVYNSWKNKHKSLKTAFQSGVTTVSPDNVTVDTVIHMGSPDPANPVGDFFKKYHSFYTEFLEQDAWFKENYFTNGIKTNRYNIIGFFQQVKELEDIFEYGSIVTPESFMKEYDKRYTILSHAA